MGGGLHRNKYVTGGMYGPNMIPGAMIPGAASTVYEESTQPQQQNINRQLSQIDSGQWQQDFMKEQASKQALGSTALQAGTSALTSTLPKLINMSPKDLQFSQNVTRGWLKGARGDYNTLAQAGAPRTTMGRTLENPGFGTGVGTALDVGGQIAQQAWSDDDPTTFTGKEKFGRMASSAGKGMRTGAQLGSIIPGVGTAIGAGIGTTVGAVTGLFKGKKEQREAQEELNRRNMAKAGLMNRGAQLRSQEREYSGYDFGVQRRGGLRRKYDHGGTHLNIPEEASFPWDIARGYQDEYIPLSQRVPTDVHPFESHRWMREQKFPQGLFPRNRYIPQTQREPWQQRREEYIPQTQRRNGGRRYNHGGPHNQRDLLQSRLALLGMTPGNGIPPGARDTIWNPSFAYMSWPPQYHYTTTDPETGNIKRGTGPNEDRSGRWLTNPNMQDLVDMFEFNKEIDMRGQDYPRPEPKMPRMPTWGPDTTDPETGDDHWRRFGERLGNFKMGGGPLKYANGGYKYHAGGHRHPHTYQDTASQDTIMSYIANHPDFNTDKVQNQLDSRYLKRVRPRLNEAIRNIDFHNVTDEEFQRSAERLNLLKTVVNEEGEETKEVTDINRWLGMFDHMNKKRKLQKSDLSYKQQLALKWYGYRDGGLRRKYDGGGVVSGIDPKYAGHGTETTQPLEFDLSNLSDEEKAQLGLDVTGMVLPPAAWASSGIDYKNMLKSMKGGNWGDALYYGGMGTLGILPLFGPMAKNVIKGGKVVNTVSNVTPYVKPAHKTTKIIAKTDKYTDAAGNVIDPLTYEYTDQFEKKSNTNTNTEREYDFSKGNPFLYDTPQYWDWQKAKRQNTLYGK